MTPSVEDERIRLEGRVELLESATARYAIVLAALTDHWWERLPAVDEVTSRLLLDEPAVAAAEPRVGAIASFAKLAREVESRRRKLTARILELEGGEDDWRGALARMRERALAQARAPALGKYPLCVSEMGATRRLALLASAVALVGLGFWLVGLFVFVWFSPLFSIGVFTLAAIAALLWVIDKKKRPLSWALFPERVFVRPVRAPPYDLPLQEAAISHEDGGLVLRHGEYTLRISEKMPCADQVAVLLDLGRVGLLQHATRGYGAKRRVFGHARTEQGEPGAVLITEGIVVFVPHQEASGLVAIFTGRAPLRRHTSDAVLEVLRLLPADLLEQLLAPLPEALGVRVLRKAGIERTYDRLTDSGGKMSLRRGTEVLDIELTSSDVGALNTVW
ncbi:MAG: hypothetical protein ACOZIN_09540 [Myxococcota bacterium]